MIKFFLLFLFVIINFNYCVGQCYENLNLISTKVFLKDEEGILNKTPFKAKFYLNNDSIKLELAEIQNDSKWDFKVKEITLCLKDSNNQVYSSVINTIIINIEEDTSIIYKATFIINFKANEYKVIYKNDLFPNNSFIMNMKEFILPIKKKKK